MEEQENYIEPELLDMDIAARTAMLFGLEMSRDEALTMLSVPLPQLEAWNELWDDIEEEYLER